MIDACERQSTEQLAAVAAEESSDTIYRIDRVSEDVLVAGLEDVARDDPLVLDRRGARRGKRVLPRGASEQDCRWRVIVDPIDGTREIMYQKRSAWILTGVAPNLGDETRIRHIDLAVQTEIPVLKQHLSDQLWAARGQGTRAIRYDRVRQTQEPLVLRRLARRRSRMASRA